MTRLTSTAVACLLGLLPLSLAHAALPAGISGAWYNPEQPGHGLSVEILSDTSALAYWYVFDPAGNPVHLYLEGQVEGSRINATAWHSRGMRFGSFDPAEHQLRRWGTVTIDFADCNAALLGWNADGPAGAGYGSGELPINRLTSIAALPCQLAAPGQRVEARQ